LGEEGGEAVEGGGHRGGQEARVNQPTGTNR
jgi:hypothetical protein